MHKFRYNISAGQRRRVAATGKRAPTPFVRSTPTIVDALNASTRRNLADRRTTRGLGRCNPGTFAGPGPRSVLSHVIGATTSPVLVVLVVTTTVALNIGVAHTVTNNRTSVLRYINVFFTVTLSIAVAIIVRNHDTGTFRTLGSVGSSAAIAIIHSNRIALISRQSVAVNSILRVDANSGLPTSTHLVRSGSLATSRSTLANRDIPDTGTASTIFASPGAPITSHAGVLCSNYFIATNGNHTIIATINSSARFNGVTHRLHTTGANVAPLRRGLTGLNGIVTIINSVITTLIFILRITQFITSNATSFSAVSRTFVASVALVITTIPRNLPAVITTYLTIGVVGVSGRGTLIGGVITYRAVNYVGIVYSSGANALARGHVAIVRTCGTPNHTLRGPRRVEGHVLLRGFYIGNATSIAFPNTARTRTNTVPRFVNGPARYTLLITTRGTKLSCQVHHRHTAILRACPFSSRAGDVAAIIHSNSNVAIFTGNDPRGVLSLYTISTGAHNRVRQRVTGFRTRSYQILNFTRHRVSSGSTSATTLSCTTSHTNLRSNVVFSNFITVISPLHRSIPNTIRHYHGTNVRLGVLANSGVIATATVTGRLNVLSRQRVTIRTHRVRRVDSRRLSHRVNHVHIVTHDAPIVGVHIIGTLGTRNGIITIANSNVGSTPTVGGTSINVTVNVTNARISGRTDSVIVLSSSFTAVIGTIR